jgi:glycosyltransferase involved in cell wall biosynthesis
VDNFGGMTIAVNTRFLLKDYLEGYGYFILESFRLLTKNHPEVDFVFIYDRPQQTDWGWGNNVKQLVVGPAARHPLLWKYWYDFKIPAALKKCGANIFVSPDGFCSMNTNIPQCLVVHDLSFLHIGEAVSAATSRYYKKNTPRFLRKATSIATVSAFSKNDILKHYPFLNPETIDVVYSAAKPIFQPIGENEKEKVKEKFTAGKEFFIYAGSIHPRKNLVNLLKAFSIFKKRQQTGMKLVLAGRLAWKYEKFLKDLSSYKYREDVIVTGYLAETDLAKLIASAYAMVYPSLHEGFGVPVLEAMQSSVPVITSKDSSMEEIAGDAALYADPYLPDSIAAQLMHIYKDESLRTQLAEKGRIRSSDFNWDRTADLLWQSILKSTR